MSMQDDIKKLEELRLEREKLEKALKIISEDISALKNQIASNQPKITWVVEYGYKDNIRTAEVTAHTYHHTETATASFYDNLGGDGCGNREIVAKFNQVLSVTVKGDTDDTPA